MQRDQLFLLRPGFFDQGVGPFVCPGCLRIEGLLACYPHVAEALEVVRVDFAKPRQPIVALLGEAHQSCPVLVIHRTELPDLSGLEIQHANGQRFLSGSEAIAGYMACVHGTGRLH